MTFFPAGRAGLSDGERGLVMAALAIAAVGALTSLQVLRQIHVPLSGAAGLAWVLVVGALALPAAGWLLRHNLGLTGLHGIARAVLSLALIVPLSGLVGGTLLLPGHGTMFGPLATVLTVAGSPGLLALWAVAIAGLHLTVRAWRDERDSIFRVDLSRL